MDAETIAAGLTPVNRGIIYRRGVAYGSTHFMARLLRPLERTGFFVRHDHKGFSPRWHLTPKGEAVRAIIEKEMKGES
jgi:DNA-binding HxlR family transcriptional regulator